MRMSSKEAAAIRKAKVALMPKILCKCGCGTLIAPMTSNYKPLQYVKGHQSKGNQHAKGKPAHNRIGDKPLTASERTKRHMQKKYAEIALMPKIPCKCGCGTMIAPITSDFKSAQYVQGHNPSGLSTRFVKGQKAKGAPFPKGDLHPNWHGGKYRIDTRTFRKFKKIIRERDSYTCMRCGITQSELSRTIEVHHLDHNPSNNDPMNLVCACGKCNIWASRHRDQEFINAEIAMKVWNRLTL